MNPMCVLCRAAELSVQRAEEAQVHRDLLVHQLTLELEDLRLELDSRAAVGKRCGPSLPLSLSLFLT